MDQAFENLKDQIRDILNHQLMILREMLASFVVEHEALARENPIYLKNTTDDRFLLIEKFNQWNGAFIAKIQELTDKNISNHEDVNSFSWGLETLLTKLDVSDIELLLVSEQIKQILIEINDEMMRNLNYLENKAAKNPWLELQSTKAQTQLIKTAIGVMELDEEEENEFSDED